MTRCCCCCCCCCRRRSFAAGAPFVLRLGARIRLDEAEFIVFSLLDSAPARAQPRKLISRRPSGLIVPSAAVGHVAGGANSLSLARSLARRLRNGMEKKFTWTTEERRKFTWRGSEKSGNILFSSTASQGRWLRARGFAFATLSIRDIIYQLGCARAAARLANGQSRRKIGSTIDHSKTRARQALHNKGRARAPECCSFFIAA